MKDISFSLFVQRERRKHMMNSITAKKTTNEYAIGRRIKDNLKMQME
jgi:hypothetical protein